MSNREKFDLSVIITAHEEGILAHKTMSSVFEALECVEAANYSYEIIIHIDKGDALTKKYFERYQNNPKIKIFENSFGDTGPSRNYAVEQSLGKYVAFLDGDDLVSKNWFIEAIKVLEKSKSEVIVHPEAILTFGINQPNILTIQTPSKSKDEDRIILVGANRWCSTLVAPRVVLKKFPYEHIKKGFGHEDYIFNIRTVEANVFHAIANKTTLFYRRSLDSRLFSANSENAVIPHMDLFAFENFNKSQIKECHPTGTVKQSIKKRAYKVYKKIRNNEKINRFITPIAKITIKVLDHESKTTKKKRIPQFIIDQWAEMNHIETQLYPHANIVNRVGLYSAENLVEIGNRYSNIATNIRHEPDYVFIVPWIVRGGADKVLFNYIAALQEIKPSLKITVISTLAAKNPWASRLPKNVDYIDFGNISNDLPVYEQEELFSRLIMQLRCKKIHIINSEYGYRWAMSHKELIKNQFELNVSLFCGEYIPGTNLKGVFTYDDPFLVDLYSVIHKIYTDNTAVIKRVMKRNGFEKEIFKIHYQPVLDLQNRPYKIPSNNDEKIHILWASRVTKTKMPSIVKEIGKKLNSQEYVIDVYGEIMDDINKNFFDDCLAIQYHGKYNGFSSIPLDGVSIFLYTSLNDGVPNVIIEAIASGLPVIASNDGGVSEVIKQHETGILVEDKLNVQEYVDAIEYMASASKEELSKYVENGQKLLHDQHSWENFINHVKTDLL